MIQTTTQKKLLAELVGMRHSARIWLKIKRIEQSSIQELEHTRDMAKAVGNAEVERAASAQLQATRDRMVEYRFELVEVGQRFVRLSSEINEHLPREAWLEALSVNRAEWETESMRQHGDSPMNVVAVLRLENSATKDNGMESRPLAWCCQMALMNAMKTSEKMDRAVHEAGNEFFGGIFGEYRERSPLERMGIPAHMIQGGDE